MENNEIKTVTDLQEAINTLVKEAFKKEYPHISPNWYHIELCPRMIPASMVIAGPVVIIRVNMPPNDPEFAGTVRRAVRSVPKMRDPMALTKYALVEKAHHEFQRVSFRNEEDILKYILPSAEVEFTVITKVVAKHLASKTTVTIESETDPTITLKSRAMMLLSHKVKA